MDWKKFAVAFGVAVIANAGMAQVHRCKDASGKISYSDVACPSSQSGDLVQRAKTREEQLEERLRIAEENERKSAKRAEKAERSAERSSYDRSPQERTVNINYRNDTPDKSKTWECTRAKQELDSIASMQTLSPDMRRSRMSAASANVSVSCR